MTRLRRRVLYAVLLGLVLAAGGFLVVASGVVPIPASSGHWGITRWLLNFAKQRSVATHTAFGDPVSLDEPWLVTKGAGHYHGGCAPCHGAPGVGYLPRVARGMTPYPPGLAERVKQYEPDELFYIVKHGIKFTGMPAFPSLERDDEVRAVVAFLLVLPELDDASYRALVYGETLPGPSMGYQSMSTGEPPPVAAASCVRCHGAEGRGRGAAAFPKLAGQRQSYLVSTMLAYGRGDRKSGIMEPVAAALDEAAIREIAAYYARMPAGPPEEPGGATSAELELGQSIAERGSADRLVPACSACHGPSPEQPREDYPRLDGQYADYLALQLRLFKQKRRGGSRWAHLMHEVADDLDDRQMNAVASFYASRQGGTP